MYDEDTAKNGDDEKTRCISSERHIWASGTEVVAVIEPKNI